MLRARRLASTVVAASLAVGGLSACRSEPSVAAYLGAAGQVSEREVQEIWDEAHDALTTQARAEAAAAETAQRDKEEKARQAGEKVKPAPTITAKPVRMPFSRADIVHALVTHELYERVAEQRRVNLPADVPYAEAAAEAKLPTDSAYVRLSVENVYFYRSLMQSVGASAAAPADADVRRVYDKLAAAGGVAPGQDYTAWKAALSPQNQQAVAAAGLIRDAVQTAAADLRVKVNPRYHPFEVSVLGTQTETATLHLLTTDFGDDQSVPVADVS
ncbi:hypothetical protein QLQ12_07310 [Actinoplanes sp. NEAU-A12]|uniref:Lipoprotein n=1 Tax=Actinoplanes sandaracinus TaxID=3045177 RepID=A0ABT6WFB0_9ACTN|nr:hypothetical protein [Actinoplanes sandaracinus]MDI6098409.1 hypothetical protein [Actinoplanes sandaracinus]